MAKTKLGGNQLNFSGMSAFTGSAGVALSSISDSSSGLVLSASRVYLAQNPAESLEAATKAYVDSVAGGGVTSQQVAYGNADGSSVASDSGLWYSPDEDKLYLSGTFEGSALQSVAALDIDALSGALALDGSGGINIGTSTDVAVDFNASTWDLDASGAITVDGVGLSLDSTSAANLTATGATLVLSTVTSGELDITSADLLDINAGANLDIDVTGTYAMDSTSTFSIDGVGASNVTTNGALTLSGSTGLNLKNDSGTIDMDSRQGAIDIDAATTIDIDGATGINIGKAADVAVDFDSAAFDLDASGAITIDGTSTFSVDAVGTSNVTTNGALTISGSTGLNLDADSGTLSIQARLGGVDVDAVAGALSLDGAGGINIGTAADVAVDFNSAAFDLDASGALTLTSTTMALDPSETFDLDAVGAITIDGASLTIGGDNDTGAIAIDSTSTFSVDAVGTSNVTTNGALTISGSTGLNLDADSGTLSIQARLGGVDVDAIAGALALDGAGGINIGTAADVAVDFDSAAFDLDASGAITIDTTSGGISLDAASGPVNLTSGDSGASVGAASTLALTAGTTSTYTAGTSIALSVAGNAVATVSANTLTISDADTLALGASTLSGETAIGWKEPSFVSNFALVTATAADTEANTKGSIVAGDGIASMVYSGSGAGAHNPGLILSGATGAESLRMNSLRVYNNGLLLQSGSSYDYVASYILTGSGNAFGGLKVEFNSAAEPVAGDVLSVDVAAVAAHGQA